MRSINILSCNCRGITAGNTLIRIRRLIKKHNLSIACFVETRADSDRLDLFCSKFSRTWEWASILAEGFSGGIIVIWKKSLGQVTPLAVSRRALHLIISPTPSSNHIISIIYNSHLIHNQRFLWQELDKIADLNFLWFLVGDFNCILSREEHRGGMYAYYYRKALLFANFIEINNLFDLQVSGSKYTWCNNQYGPARRWARLDRCLINNAW